MKKILSSGLFLFLAFCLASQGFTQESSDFSLFGSGSRNANESTEQNKDQSPDVKAIFDQQLGEGGGETKGRAQLSRSAPLATLENYQSAPMVSEKNLSAVNPDAYFLQPGDSLTVETWTPYHNREATIVSSLGTINLSPIGDVPVKGVSLRNLSTRLTSILRRYYKDVQVNADLTAVRLVRVQVLGEVKAPGSYELSGISGALDAIGKAGGMTEKSSLREIELRKNGKLAQTLDYFKWRLLGDERENPYLEPNEIIYVPVIKNRVVIDGEVKRPGAYEMRAGEKFADLLTMAGDYTREAMIDETKLSRIKDSGPGNTVAMARQYPPAPPGSEVAFSKIRDSKWKVNLSVTDSMPLQDGDSIYVPPLSLFMKKIRVMGEINGVGLLGGAQGKSIAASEANQVGWYRLHENEKVRDVVLNLGGLTARADSAHARVERKDSRGMLAIMPVNLQKLFADGDETQNIALQDGDALVVPAVASNVFVMGEVGRPGVVPYAPGNQVREYLALAGGPTSHSNLKHAKLIRQVEGSAQPKVFTLNLHDSLLGKTAESGVPVEPGDVIYIPRTEVSGLSDVINMVSNYAILKALFFH